MFIIKKWKKNKVSNSLSVKSFLYIILNLYIKFLKIFNNNLSKNNSNNKIGFFHFWTNNKILII